MPSGSGAVTFQHSLRGGEVGPRWQPDPDPIVPPCVSQECPGLQPRSPHSLPDLGVWAGVHSIRPGSGETPRLSPPEGQRSGQGRARGFIVRCLPGSLRGICAGESRVRGPNGGSGWKGVILSWLLARFPGSADSLLSLSHLGEEPHRLARFSAEVLSSMAGTGVLERGAAGPSLCLLAVASPTSPAPLLTPCAPRCHALERSGADPEGAGGAHSASRTRAHQGGAAAPS